MKICGTCGFPIPPRNVSFGYAGPMCAYEGEHPPYRPTYAPMHPVEGAKPMRQLTEEDVRRIVREELGKSGEAPK